MSTYPNCTLWCLVRGDSAAFKVSVPPSADISDLKQRIHLEKDRAILHDVNAQDLVLWKPIIQIDRIPKATCVERVHTLDFSKEAIELDEGFKVAAVFSQFVSKETLERLQKNEEDPLEIPPRHDPATLGEGVLLKKHLHIVVQKPDTEVEENMRAAKTQKRSGINKDAEARAHKRVFMPPEFRLDLPDLTPRIHDVLKEVEPIILDFLQAPHPIWDPPAHFEDRLFFEELQIPAFEDGSPSLLLHKLGDAPPSVASLVNDIFQVGTFKFLCNTSGSGKTKVLLEGLARHWGFYFVAAPDQTRVGVGDIQQAFDNFNAYSGWKDNIFRLPEDRQVEQEETNKTIAHRFLMTVLVARTLVFKRFVEVAKRIRGGLDDNTKYDWLRFQLSDKVSPTRSSEHPFFRMEQCLRRAAPDALREILSDFHMTRDALLGTNELFFVFDEAQAADKRYPNAFMSSQTKVPRSPLREIVATMLTVMSPTASILISGTGLSLSSVHEAITSGAGKLEVESNQFKLIHDFGGFYTQSQLRAYMEQYLPQAFLQSQTGNLLQRRVCSYLCGRYRFLSGFITLLLRCGLQAPHRLFNHYINMFAGYVPNDIPPSTYDHEMQVDEERRMFYAFEWARLREDEVAMRQVRGVVQSHLSRKGPPTYGPVVDRLVEYGVARLRSDFKGEITEPLAFVSLLRWLEGEAGQSLGESLLPRIANPDSRGGGSEELTLLYLHKALSTPTPLNRIFQFRKGNTPPWAGKRAQLVIQVEHGRFEEFDFLGPQPTHVHGATLYVETIQDVLGWVEGNPPTAMFALPANSFGPDLMGWIRFEGEPPVLLLKQDKSYTTGNKDTMDATTLHDAIHSLTPEHWFVGARQADREKLIHTLNCFRILAVVAGYPLPPLLESNAPSVNAAIGKLTPQTTFAVMNIDYFRAFFRESNNIPLLDALDDSLARTKAAEKARSLGSGKSGA